MRKLLSIAIFLFIVPACAQDTLPLFDVGKSAIPIDSVKTLHTFPKNFKARYTDKEFVYSYKAPAKNAWDRFVEWLAGYFKNLFHFTSDESAMNLVVMLFRGFAVIIVIFVIYMIVKALLNKEGRWIFGKNSDTKLIRYDDVERNLHQADFKKLIENAMQAGEERLVIRYYYLWLLKRMTDKSVIEWDIEKTNSDYLYEIKDPAFKAQFSYLSYLYDYVWYGEFDLDSTTFSKTKTAFENAIKSHGNG